MSKVCLNNDRLSFWEKLFFSSVVLGIAVAYSKLYLFHVVLLGTLLSNIFNRQGGQKLVIPKALEKDFLFFFVFFSWYAISILWSENKAYSFQYLGYIFCGVSISLLTVFFCKKEKKIEGALNVVGFWFSVEIFLSVMEGLELIRLPFSPFSQYRTYFGRSESDLAEFDLDALQYINSLPTGFFGNSNNLAATLAFVLPFFLLSKSYFFKALGGFAILFVVLMAGSRGALIACFVSILLSVFVYGKKGLKIYVSGIFVLLVLLSGSALDFLQQSENKKISEIGYLGDALIEMVDGGGGGDSASVRNALIVNGLDALYSTYGVGVGGGGSKTVQEKYGGVGDHAITSMHNFWIELLVEGGLLIFVLFVVWYFYLGYRVYIISKKKTNNFLNYFSSSIFVSLVTVVFSAVSASSFVYVLPMWLLFGGAMALIVAARERVR